MIKTGFRTKLLFAAGALSPLSALVFLIEVMLGLKDDSPTRAEFVLFNVPYQGLLTTLFFIGIPALVLSVFSLARDNRTPKRNHA
jgi:hypothetical protein